VTLRYKWSAIWRSVSEEDITDKIASIVEAVSPD
jgi:hypothetical protein